jgi:hypothetical protein
MFPTYRKVSMSSSCVEDERQMTNRSRSEAADHDIGDSIFTRCCSSFKFPNKVSYFGLGDVLLNVDPLSHPLAKFRDNLFHCTSMTS